MAHGNRKMKERYPLFFLLFFVSCLCACERFGFASWLGLARGLGAHRGWEHPTVPAVFRRCCQAPLRMLEVFPGQGLVFNGSKSLL